MVVGVFWQIVVGKIIPPAVGAEKIDTDNELLVTGVVEQPAAGVHVAVMTSVPVKALSLYKVAFVPTLLPFFFH